MESFFYFYKKVNLFLVTFLIITSVCLVATLDKSYGTEVSATKAYSFKTNNFEGENISVQILGSQITVSGKSMLGRQYYRVIIRNDIDGTSTYWGGVKKFNSDGTFSTTFDTSNFSIDRLTGGTGDIVFRSSDLPDASIPGNGYTLQGIPIDFSDLDNPYIMKYNGIIGANNKAKLLGSYINPKAFLDVKMLTESSQDQGRFSMTNTQADYIQNLSNKICSGTEDDYNKLLKIYTYITKNFYYDYYAFHGKHYKAQVNPYNLCYAIENGDKAKSVCDGFSSTFAALARAQGIPTRLVVGHAISNPQETWMNIDESEIMVIDHVWNEAYVNGKWINIDVTRGTSSQYYNPNYKTEAQPVYKYLGTSRYSEFDLTDEGLANTKLYFRYKGGPYNIGYVTGEDKTTWGNFLSKSNGYGKSNGSRINANYTASNTFTWKSTSSGSAIEVTPEGRISRISIKRSYTSDKSKLLGGFMSLKGMNKLKILTCYNQNLNGLNVSGCTSLTQVAPSYNKIKTLDLTQTKLLSTLSFLSNPATTIKFRKSNGCIVSIYSSSNGTIGCTYTRSNNHLKLYVHSNIGYKLSGIYNYSGKRVSTRTYYNTYLPSIKYTVKYKFNPYSYKYKLSIGNNQSYRKPYNMAVQKRLKTLGYYSGDADGIFDSGVSKAVKRFSKRNGFSAAGYINELRWKKLFSTKAKVK